MTERIRGERANDLICDDYSLWPTLSLPLSEEQYKMITEGFARVPPMKRENMTTSVMIRPTSDRIVVKRDDPAKQTPGGIVLPNESRDVPPRGTVVAVGPGRILEDGKYGPMEVSEGDTVVFSPYHSTEVRVGDEFLVVMRESEVLFIE